VSRFIDVENKAEQVKSFFENLTTDINILENKTENYILLSSEKELLCSSKIKIPFEPKGETKVLRNAIQKELSLLNPSDNAVFCAEYGDPCSSRSDIENSLFYNLGISHFKNALTQTTPLYFQRKQQNEIRICNEDSFTFFYHYYFTFAKNLCFWWESVPICEWNKIPLNKVCSSTKAFEYFAAIKSHPQSVQCFSKTRKCNLGMKIQLFVPKKARFSNVASVMKPMIDGIISAFHASNKIDVQAVCTILNTDTRLFSSDEKTCLDSYPYVIPHKNTASVIWSPADDRLDYVFVEPIRVDDTTFSFSGKLFSIPCFM